MESDETRAPRDLLPDLRAMVESAQEYMQDYQRDWQELREYVSGERQLSDWQSQMPPELQDDFVVCNFTYSALQHWVSVLMQVTPQWYVVAEDEEQDDVAAQVTTWLKAHRRVHNLDLQQQMAYAEALITGNGVLYPYYDKRREEVLMRCIPADMVYPDPTANCLDEASFVALRQVYGEDLAEKLYEGRINIEEAAEAEEDQVGEQTANKVGRMIEVWEVYHDFGKELTVYTGDQILWHGDNPLPGQRYPIHIFQMDKKPTAFWSDSLVTQMRPLQDLMNKTRTRIFIYQRYMVNPIFWTDSGQTDLDLSPGAINYLTRGSQLRAVEMPALPPFVMQNLQLTEAAFDSVTGVHEVARGIRPVGTTSGISLEVLQQAAQVRMTGPAQQWVHVMTALGQHVLELMQQNYAELRSLPVLEGGEARRVRVEPEALSTVRREGEQSVVIPHRYQVVMQPQGDLPVNPASWIEIFFRAHAARAVDNIGLLDGIRLPGREAIKERMMAQEMAAAEGEQAAMQTAEQQQMAGAQQAAIQAEDQRLRALFGEEHADLLQGYREGTLPPEVASEVPGYDLPQGV